MKSAFKPELEREQAEFARMKAKLDGLKRGGGRYRRYETEVVDQLHKVDALEGKVRQF